MTEVINLSIFLSLSNQKRCKLLFKFYRKTRKHGTVCLVQKIEILTNLLKCIGIIRDNLKKKKRKTKSCFYVYLIQFLEYVFPFFPTPVTCPSHHSTTHPLDRLSLGIMWKRSKVEKVCSSAPEVSQVGTRSYVQSGIHEVYSWMQREDPTLEKLNKNTARKQKMRMNGQQDSIWMKTGCLSEPTWSLQRHSTGSKILSCLTSNLGSFPAREGKIECHLARQNNLPQS